MTRTISTVTTTDLVPACALDLFGPRGRRARLLASGFLCGGTLRGIAAAAGIMIVLGASPAFAQCFSGTGGNIAGAGCTATAGTGFQATAVGANANATSFGATALGEGVTANGQSATATGYGASAIGLSASAFGSAATANGITATATGYGANATGLSASAFGSGAVANGITATATGASSLANATGATAVGASAQATATGAVAVGQNSAATGVNSIAIGNGAIATGSIAVGAAASAANGGAAFGDGAVATGSNSAAVGTNSSATFANSAAFGNGATATAPNQVAIGTASNTYKLSGITSAASLAAQSGPISVVTTDAAGHLAAANFTLPDISGLQSNVSVLQQQMKQSFEGSAIAIAMGGGALPSDKRFAVSANVGTFRGQNAVGANLQVRANDYLVLNGGVGAGFAQGGVGGRVGATLAW